MHPMLSRRLPGLIVVGCLLLACLPAWGQPSIPGDVVASKSALSAAQQQTIDETINHWAGVIQEISSTDEQIAKAREELTAYLNPGASANFATYYSTALSRALAPLMSSERASVRLNVMIAAGSLVDPGVTDLIKPGLADENPAVRYWAGKAISLVSSRSVLDEARQADLLGGLVEASQKETSPAVLQQMFVGLSKLSVAGADQALLRGLNARVAAHTQDVNEPFNADLEALVNLGDKIVTQSQSTAVDPEVVKLLTLVAYRYVLLTSTLLANERVEETNMATTIAMLKASDKLLRWAVPHQNPDPKLKLPGNNAAIAAGLWAEVRNWAVSWKEILREAPFGFTDQQLSLSAE